MSNDTRVVQMQFDNKNFERNIAKSQSSLERFKKSLNFEGVGKGLSKLGEGIKDLALETLSNNVQRLTDKFTGLGNAGEYVLSRIRASLEGVALQTEQFVKSLTLEQIDVGQNKYDALTKSVQTIVASGAASEEQAYSVMERVMEYTNQTSHSFETMVAQISSLTSIGVPLSRAEKLMEAFANASTKAGADASHAAIAMQTYSKAMGSYLTKNEFDTLNLTAKVVTKEWREQMIEAGIAAGDLEKDTKGVIKTAKKYGKQVTVTADTIENTLNKKWASKKTLSLFGEKYVFGDSVEDLKHPERAIDSFGKEAYLTGQRALTFADALNAVKEAISGGWMETFRIMFGDLTDAMNLWTGSCNKVIDALSGLSEARNDILQIWKDIGGRDSILKLIFGEMEDTEGNTMYESAYGIVDMLSDIGNMISEAVWSTYKNLIPKSEQDRILDVVNSNLDVINKNLVAMGRSDLVRTNPFTSFDELWNSDYFTESGGRNSFFATTLDTITEQVQEFVQGINDWFNEVDVETGMTRMEKIETVLSAIGRTVAFVVEIGAGIAHFFEVLAGDDYLGPSLQTISDLLVNLGISVTEAENETSNANGINKFFENLAEVLKPACELVNLIVGSLSELIMAMVDGEKENSNFGDVLVKIGDILKKVVGFLTSVATPVATFVSEVSSILADLFKDGFTPEGVEKAKQRFSKAFGNLWESLKEVFRPLVEKIGAFFGLLWNEIKSRVVAWFEDPESLGHKILGVLQKVADFLSPVWNFLKNVWEAVKGLFTDENGKLRGPTLFDTLKTIFLSENVTALFKKLKQLAADGGLYKLLMGVLGVVAIWRIIKAVNTIGGFFDDVGGNLKAGILGTYEWFSEKIQGIAKGLLMLTAAVAVLGMMDTGSVIKGVIALGIIMAEFIGFMHLMNKINPATITQQAAMTGAISLFAGSIGLLVLALLPFAFVSWEGFARMIAGLTLVLLDLAGFMAIVTYLPLGTGSLGPFIGFAVSLGILIFSLVPLMLADWEAMLRGVAGLGLVMLELIGFMTLVTYLPIGTASLGPFIGFAASLGILMFSLVPIMLADWEAMLRGLAGLGLVMLELISFMLLVTYLPIGTGSLGPFIGFAASLGILMLSLVPLMIADWGAMFRGVIGLGIVLAELIGFMELMYTLNLSTMGLGFTGIIGFTVAIGILMLSLIPLMTTDWGGMLRAVLGLGIILAELIGFMELMYVLSLSTMGINFVGIIGFSVAIAILILAIKSFAYMEWDEWARAIAGLTVVLLEILGFIAVAETITYNPAAIGMVIAICLSIGVMALMLSMAMNEVRSIKWEVIAAFSAGMATMVLSLAMAISVLSAIPLTAGIKAIALIGIAIAALLGIVALIGPYMIEAFGNSFSQLSGKLEMISGLIKGFADRMGGIDEGNIGKAGDILDQLKGVMRKLSGWDKFSGDLNNFAYSMFVLGTGMEIFNNHVGNAITDLDTNAKASLKFIQDLSGCANDLDTISKMNLDNLISAVAMLGGAMTIYAYGAKEVQGLLAPGDTPDEETVQSAIAILQAISTGLSDAGGFTIPENMPNEQALSLFGASLAALATALVQFEEAGKGLSTGFDTALYALECFRSLKDKLVSTEFKKNLGAAIGIFDKQGVSKDDLAAFGTNIEQLGLALSAFNNSVTYLNEVSGKREAIDFSNAISTLDSLVALQGKLGWDFGPIIKFLAGRRKDFTDLGGEIEALGTALSDFIEKVGGVDEQGKPKLDTKLFEDAIDIADKVADYLNVLKEKMGNVGGIWEAHLTLWYGREYDFTDLETQLTALATGLEGIGQLKKDKKLLSVEDTKGMFEVVDEIIGYLQTLKTKMGTVGGIWNGLKLAWSGRSYDFTDLEKQLISLGNGLNGISGVKIDDIPTAEEMNAAFPTIDALIEYMKTLKDKVGDGEGSVGGIWNILKTAFIGRKFDFTDLETQLTAIGTGLNSIAEVNVDSSGNSIFNAEGRGAALDTMDALIDYMQTLSGKLGRVGGIAEFFSNLWEGKEADFEYLGTQLGHLGEGLGKFQAGITKNGSFDAGKVSKALGALDHLVSMMQTFSVLDEKMDAISQSYGLSSYTMKDFIMNMWDSLSLMTDGLPEGGSVVDKLAEFVKEFDFQLTELGGLENENSIDILNGVATAISTLVTATRNMQDDNGNIVVDFSTIGTQICNGIITGITEGQSGVIDAAVNMALAAYEAAKGALDINSPSRIFAGLGSSIGEGFVKGMGDQQGAVEVASEDLSTGAVDSATDAMAAFAALMSQEIDANPTITPVLDLSNITAGSEAIDGMLGGRKELSLAGAGGDYSSYSVPRSDHTSGDYRGQDLSGVYAAIESLGGRIDAMGNKISNMQIVMNTGVLVGQVTDGVNRNLGAKTTYGRRRN